MIAETRTVGRYEVVRLLARGGMAEILLARSRGLAGFSRRVVIKRLLPNLVADPEYVTMFLDEARIAAALQHANIVQVFEIGQDLDGYFLVMEHVDGKNLRRILERCERRGRRIPLEHAIAVGMNIASGLHAAHEACNDDGSLLGIVHRDVSPTNVMITFDGCVKLIDFGIALASKRETVTRTGVLKGKPSYMAPEQIQRQPVDRRADIFCLGSLLFEITTGTALVSESSQHESLRRIVKGTLPRPSEIVSGYPIALEKILMRALQRDPNDRYSTAEQFLVALERFALDNQLRTSQHGLGAFVQSLFPLSPAQSNFERAKTTRLPLRMPLRPASESSSSGRRRITAEGTPTRPKPVTGVGGSVVLELEDSVIVAPENLELPPDHDDVEDKVCEVEEDSIVSEVEISDLETKDRVKRSASWLPRTIVAKRDSTGAGTRGDRLIAGAITAALVCAVAGWALLSSYRHSAGVDQNAPGVVAQEKLDDTTP